LMPVIILGGIYGGIFTPTEAAAVSCVYGLAVGVFVYKTVRMKECYLILIDSARQSAVVMFIVCSSSIFGYLVTINGIATAASNLLIEVSGGSKFLFLLIVNILLLIVGCFLDGNSAFYIFTPILYPVAMKLGIDGLAFGVLMVMNLAIGMVTPPVGVNLYVACSLGNVSIKEICKGVLPFLLAAILTLLIITYFPIFCTFLPSLATAA
ncbi:MAG: TRAP transporter large permease subunit, partial [Lawsonibacter sp.]|nr:TRAP transporter large permease subunit [Lawsonibacter sp.]